jgi:hypothetical protein
MSRIGKFIELGSRLSVASVEGREDGEELFSEYRILFRGSKSVLKVRGGVCTTL